MPLVLARLDMPNTPCHRTLSRTPPQLPRAEIAVRAGRLRRCQQIAPSPLLGRATGYAGTQERQVIDGRPPCCQDENSRIGRNAGATVHILEAVAYRSAAESWFYPFRVAFSQMSSRMSDCFGESGRFCSSRSRIETRKSTSHAESLLSRFSQSSISVIYSSVQSLTPTSSRHGERVSWLSLPNVSVWLDCHRTSAARAWLRLPLYRRPHRNPYLVGLPAISAGNWHCVYVAHPPLPDWAAIATIFTAVSLAGKLCA